MPPSYEELVALVSVLSVQLTEQTKLIEALRVELAALRRQAGRDSSNSSQPPSQDGPASTARAKAGKDCGESTDSSGDVPDKRVTGKRKPGGQPGHRGGGLAPPRSRTGPRRSNRPPAVAAAGP